MDRIPYVIDNIHVTLAGVLNDLLAGQHEPQVDIATAYFSVRGFELLRNTLPGVRRLRLLLGDNPQEPDAVGLRPDSASYLRHELNAEPLAAANQRLVEELIRFLRRYDVQWRLTEGQSSSGGERTFL